MSEIAGIVNYKKDISDDIGFRKMVRLPISSELISGMFLSKNCNMSKKILKDELDNVKCISIEGGKYSIVYDGEIYNKKEIKEKLEEKGFDVKNDLESEMLLKLYILLGTDMSKYLNGVYSIAIWNDKKKELFLLRDRFGIKPLFYFVDNEKLLFASQIKVLLEHPDVDPVVNDEGIGELLSVGPCHSPGLTPFKYIKELEPASFIIYNQNGLYKEKYWRLETKEHTDSESDTAENIRYILKDAIKRQMDYSDEFGVLLSGGLDSSIIAKFANDFYKEKTGKKLKTFSVDYKDQDKNFVKNDFQPNKDDYYIDIMVNKLDTEHKRIILDTPELADYLEDAMLARDYPGMADVDSSYLLLFKNLKPDVRRVLSGECSDEIFGGYPWYFKEELRNSETFPWSSTVNERQMFLDERLLTKIDLKEYSNKRYNETLSNIEYGEFDGKENKEHRRLMYLTLNWFMETLIDRTDRMCRYNLVDARVPFCDYRLVEYAWNIPWNMKSKNGEREKGLLRYAMKGYLPDEILERKKSPYPKTHNPNYLDKVVEKLKSFLDSKDCRIKEIISEKYLKELIETKGSSFSKPWFGQLMTGPQLIAYFIQLEMWIRRYDIIFEI